jgi:hypothetical protein
MSHAEIKHIFKIADKDKNNKVDEEEWHFFHEFFVAPYEGNSIFNHILEMS